MNDLKIIAVTKTLADIFWGRMGWKIHTRARRGTNGGLLQVSGNKLPANLAIEATKSLGW